MSDDRSSPRDAEPAPAALVALADLLGGESSRSKRFLGGLVAGALVGAAVAGSSLLRHRLARPISDEPAGRIDDEPRRLAAGAPRVGADEEPR